MTIQQKNANWGTSKCVNLWKIKFEYDTVFGFGVEIDIFGCCEFSICFVSNVYLKIVSLKHFSDKVPRAKWPRGTSGILCFCKNLDFSIAVVIKITIFSLPPLLRFLCPMNSFYSRCASCMCNISSIFNISNRSINYIDASRFFSGHTRHRNLWESETIDVPSPFLLY